MSKEDSRWSPSWYDRKVKLIRGYDCLAVENITNDYYCTEKIWQSLAIGCFLASCWRLLFCGLNRPSRHIAMDGGDGTDGSVLRVFGCHGYANHFCPRSPFASEGNLDARRRKERLNPARTRGLFG
jgi:hypothetical protein